MKKFLLAILALFASTVIYLSTTVEVNGQGIPDDCWVFNGDNCDNPGRGCLDPVIIIGGPIHTGN
ncbi:hypothetical protein [Hugenholtzia roseola]|uniref:hypothetical protein n=1 Tax=Hugenholtzia roseola TaxID=1002 RepID=UPI00047DCA65|nr:hypothetical protein [Hugenholtzia roseola]